MSPSEPHPPLDTFESQLAALWPAASHIDRDKLLYEAGRAAASAEPRRRSPARWLSPLVTVASISLAVLFAGLWWNEVTARAPQIAQPEMPPVAEVARLPSDVVKPQHSGELRYDRTAVAQFDSPQESYFHLRQVALSEGIDAWPERVPAGEPLLPTNARSAWPFSDG